MVHLLHRLYGVDAPVARCKNESACLQLVTVSVVCRTTEAGIATLIV